MRKKENKGGRMDLEMSGKERQREGRRGKKRGYRRSDETKLKKKVRKVKFS